jgi:hypothetical protein
MKPLAASWPIQFDIPNMGLNPSAIRCSGDQGQSETKPLSQSLISISRARFLSLEYATPGVVTQPYVLEFEVVRLVFRRIFEITIGGKITQ